MYERRGDELYPGVLNDLDDYGVPAFEIRGDEAYPSIYNNRHTYGLPAFELRDGEWEPTPYNDVDDDTYVSDTAGDQSEDSSPYRAPSDRETEEAAGAAMAVGVLAVLGLGAAAVNARRRRRERKAQAHVGYPLASQQWQSYHPASAAPAGWYDCSGVQRYWDGRQWAPPHPATTQVHVETSGQVNGMSAAPGWYPVLGGRRYWDGQRWTGRHYPDPIAPFAPYGRSPLRPATPPSQALLIGSWVVTLMTCGYMLPWAIAATRGRPDVQQIGLVNAFLGWTVIGWFVPLVQALS